MSQMQIDAVLAQIRALSTQTRMDASQAAAPRQSGASEFANILSKGIDQVNQADVRASQLSAAFQRGEPGVELPQVMLEMQKASVSFRALTEVRNKLVSAYQEIMNMQL